MNINHQRPGDRWPGPTTALFTRSVHTLDDLEVELAADLTDDFTDPQSKITAQDVISILGRPNDVVAVVINAVRTRIIDPSR